MEHIITNIPIEQLHESPFNPRRTFNDAGLQELATDIKAQGVLQPILVRNRMVNMTAANPDDMFDGYELIFGHRRLRAAVLAGLTQVPCQVRSMTDDDARMAQISENLAREDIHPIEEAEGFHALMTEHDISAEALVERTGKSRSYIYGRLSLLKACPKVRDACLANKIGSETALLIARLRTDKLQQKALGYIEGKYIDMEDGGQKSYRQIRELLREKFTLGIKDAIFDTSDPFLLPDAGDCTSCAKRSGNAPEFQDLTEDTKNRYGYSAKGSDSLCTDPDCFDAKKKAHLRNQAAQLEQQGKTVVDGAKARAAIDAYGHVKGAYIALKDVKTELKKATGTKPETVLIQDPRTGKTVEAVKVSELEGAGVKCKKPSEREEMTWKERMRREEEERGRKEEKAKEEALVRTALLMRVRQAVADTERSAFDLGIVARVALGGVDWNDRNPLASLYGLKSFDTLQKKVGQMNVSELTLLMMDCALVANTSPSWHNLKNQPEALLAAAKHYGVDPNLVRAELVQASAPSDSGAAPTPDAAIPPARWVKYQDPMTGLTWSGRGLMPRWLKVAMEEGKTLADFETSTPPPAARATKGAGAKAKKAKPETAAEAPAARARKAAKPGAGAKQGKGKSKTIQKVEASSAGNDQMDEVGLADEERDLGYCGVYVRVEA
jgi:ParB/RepB/Spo0J family partition protein